MRVASLLEQVQAIQDRRSALYQSYDDTVEKYKSTKDVGAFTANRKKIETDYKQLTQQINGLLTKLKAEGSESADKVGSNSGCSTIYPGLLCWIYFKEHEYVSIFYHFATQNLDR